MAVLVSLLVVGAVIGLQAGAALAAPSTNVNHHVAVCNDGTTVAIITTPSGDASWTVDTSGQTSQTPAHVKELSLRVYPGDLTTEPSTEPLFSLEKSYGNRVGQGEAIHCSGHDVDSGPDGPVTLFFDAEVTNL